MRLPNFACVIPYESNLRGCCQPQFSDLSVCTYRGSIIFSTVGDKYPRRDTATHWPPSSTRSAVVLFQPQQRHWLRADLHSLTFFEQQATNTRSSLFIPPCRCLPSKEGHTSSRTAKRHLAMKAKQSSRLLGILGAAAALSSAYVAAFSSSSSCYEGGYGNGYCEQDNNSAECGMSACTSGSFQKKCRKTT